jgi:branched-chain amino acid transport system substrate-binding protein
MNRRSRYLRALFPAVLLGFLVAACAPAGGPGASPGGDKGEIIVLSEFPTSGASAASGLPAQNGVAYAIQVKKEIKGFRLVHQPNDHSVAGVHDPQKAAQNIQQAVQNSRILGVVGPFNSNVARAIIPVANRVPIVLISPANTNECLTQDFPYCDPKPAALRPSGKNNYFRIAAPDTVQGPAMADFAVDTLKVKNIAVWSDNETFGKGVADTFGKRLETKGGRVVLRQDFDTKTTADFRTFLQRAKQMNAEAIYAGAVSATKGCIPRAQMQGIFDMAVPYLGPDGILDAQCIKDAGPFAGNIYATNAAADATQDAAQKSVVDGFKAAFTKKEDLGAYTFPAYDSALILIDAIGRAIDTNGGRMPTREQVIDAVAATKDLKLTTGTYTFDRNGDPTRATMAFHQTKGSPLDWVFVSQFAVGQ